MKIADVIFYLQGIKAVHGDIDVHIDGAHTDNPATVEQMKEQLRPHLWRRYEKPDPPTWPPNPRRPIAASYSIPSRESYILLIGRDNSYRGRG